MKLPVRALLSALCAALILALPFFVSAPDLLPETRAALEGGQEEIDFGTLGTPEVRNGGH